MTHARSRSILPTLLGALLAASCVIHTGRPEDNAQHGRHARPRHGQKPPPPPRPNSAPARPTPAQPMPAQPGPAATATARPPIGPRAPLTPTLPPQPPREVPPTGRTAPALLPEGVGTGRPPGFQPGAPAAYWIWQGPRGDWRLKTTTAQMLHLFRGLFHGTSGPVTNVHPSQTELRDRVWNTRDGWAFSFKTQGHADGFTFITRDNGCVTFELQLDGGPHPKRIFIGRGELVPPSNHFTVCPKGATPRKAR